eukprot:6183564-Pleurochrysis_carterae.AAC.2
MNKAPSTVRMPARMPLTHSSSIQRVENRLKRDSSPAPLHTPSRTQSCANVHNRHQRDLGEAALIGP